MRPERRARVVLYGKPGCHLCEQARTEIQAAKALCEFDLHEVDISLDAALFGRYAERIPVVEVNGSEAFEFHIEAAALCRALDTVSP